MNPNRRAVIVAVVAMLLCAFIFFKLAVSHRFYAPGAFTVQQKVASYGDSVSPVLNSYALGAAIYKIFRKTYAAIAFAILGFVSAPLFARPVRVRNVAILLCAIRVVLEIFERIASNGDPLLESAIDVALGTAAGALGAMAYNAVARKAERT